MDLPRQSNSFRRPRQNLSVESDSEGAFTPTSAQSDATWSSSGSAIFTPRSATPDGTTSSEALRDCTISFAVDVSGSTTGRGLQAEKVAVYEIARRLSEKAERSAKILPWDSRAYPVTGMPGLLSLSSRGGTDPGVLTRNLSTLQALQNSQLWFLFTDGEIYDTTVQNFARSLPANRLHGTACITIVVGTTRTPPMKCNISVGVSVFAVSPHCLFGYFDVETNEAYMLQCKGCFESLLGEKSEIELTETTTWADLPKLSYDALAKISIPAPKQLSPDEISLGNDLVVNMAEIWSGRLKDPRVVDQIFSSDKVMQSASLWSQANGNAGKMMQWAQSVQTPQVDPYTAARTDTASARNLVVAAVSALRAGSSELVRTQTALAAAHRQNLMLLHQSVLQQRQINRRRQLGYQNMNQKVSRSYKSTIGLQVMEPSLQQQYVAPQETVRVIYTPGIQYDSDDCCRGECKLCRAPDSILSLLVVKPRVLSPSRNFPSTHSKSRLASPLSCGSLPETNVISSFVACEACAYFMAELKICPVDGELIRSLPLVSFKTNKAIWINAVCDALMHSIAAQDVELLLPAILHSAWKKIPDDMESASLALKWSFRQSINSAVIHHPPTNGSLMSGSTPLLSAISASMINSANPDVVDSLLKYPVESFRVVMDAVSLENANPPDARSLVFFWNYLLYSMTVRYCESQIAFPAAMSTFLSQLSDTPLLDKDTLTILKTLQPYYLWVEGRAGTALATFVHCLALQPLTAQPDTLFITLRSKPQLLLLFTNPAAVTPEWATALIESLG